MFGFSSCCYVITSRCCLLKDLFLMRFFWRKIYVR